MNFFEAVLLGVIQGITEFLPISSSAHLIIAEKALGLKVSGLSFEVTLHLASILAVLIFFRKDIVKLVFEFFLYITKKEEKYKGSFYFSIYIVIATLITGVLGILLEDFMNEKLKSMTTISISFFFTGMFLLIIEKVIKYGSKTEENMTFKDAVLIGLGQTLAIIPGISRAGSTLVVSLWRGLEKETAVRFSFLLSIPVILGSSILMIPQINFNDLGMAYSEILVSFIASFVFAIIGIKWLINFLNKSRLSWFAYYCFFLSITIFIFFR